MWLLPQRPGCLPVGGTGAALPVPETLPFRGAPGRTSSSSLGLTDQTEAHRASVR